MGIESPRTPPLPEIGLSARAWGDPDPATPLESRSHEFAHVSRPPRPSRGWGRWLLLVGSLTWFAVLILVPLLALVRAALAPGAVYVARILATPEVMQAFVLTLIITLAATAINTVMGLMLALVLTRQRFRGQGLADSLIDMPFAVSPIVAGLMLVVVYGPNSPLGHWLDQTWGFRVVYAWPGLLLASTFVTIPFVVREVVPVLREIGREQEEVAATLGAGPWYSFWRVTFPSIRWALAYGMTLTVARSLGEFGALLVVSGNILGRTQTATLYIHDSIESFQAAGAYAASLALAATSFLLLLLIETLRERVHRQEKGHAND